MADGVGFEPTEGFHLRRFSRPVLSTAQSPIRLLRLLCSLALRALQVISKFIFLGIIYYIFYILYILYEKVDTNLDTTFNKEIIIREKN